MGMTIAELLKDKAAHAAQPSASLITLGPDVPVAEAVALMNEKQISSVIVAEHGQMLGLITLREILAALHTRGDALMRARCEHVMKLNPPTAKPTDTADQLRQLMTELHITHVPVMEGGQLVGILSFHDIARSAVKDAAFENKLLKQYIKNWPE